jgi:hypothetical protein
MFEVALADQQLVAAIDQDGPLAQALSLALVGHGGLAQPNGAVADGLARHLYRQAIGQQEGVQIVDARGRRCSRIVSSTWGCECVHARIMPKPARRGAVKCFTQVKSQGGKPGFEIYKLAN